MYDDKKPSDITDDTVIARYMSLPKIMHLLEFGTAYFPSINQLRNTPGNHGDPLEGAFSPADTFLRDGRAAIFDVAMNSAWPSADGKNDSETRDILPPHPVVSTVFGSFEIKVGRTLTGINDLQCNWVDVWCWHEHEHECMSMWRQYGAGDGAVLIKSTVGSLKKSLSIKQETTLYVGAVQYVNRNQWNADAHDELSVFLQKSRVYSTEKEVRALLFDKSSDINEERCSVGRSIPVNLGQLITEIAPHPDTPVWMVDLLDSVTRNRLGMSLSASQIAQERSLFKSFPVP